jgi:hypothetical protein
MPTLTGHGPKGSPRPRVGEKPPPGGAVGGCPAVPPGATARAVAPTCPSVRLPWQGFGNFNPPEAPPWTG